MRARFVWCTNVLLLVLVSIGVCSGAVCGSDSARAGQHGLPMYSVAR